MSKISVLRLVPGESPEEVEIEHTLKSLQHEVGGHIEAVYPFEDEVAIVLNEEGKLEGLEPCIPLYDDNGIMYDIVVGTCLIVGLGEEDFASLPPELMQKYKAMYSRNKF